MDIQRRLEIGLKTLAALIQGNITFAADHIEQFSDFVLPLLTSELVGSSLPNTSVCRTGDGVAGEGAAFEVAKALAMSLPEPLHLIPLDVAIVLRIVSLHEHNGSISYEEILQHSSMLSVMQGMSALEAQSTEKPAAVRMC